MWSCCWWDAEKKEEINKNKIEIIKTVWYQIYIFFLSFTVRRIFYEARWYVYNLISAQEIVAGNFSLNYA